MKSRLCSLPAMSRDAVPAWTAPAPDDAAMLKLATGSGCMICHHIEPGTTGPDGLGPIGATWR